MSSRSPSPFRRWRKKKNETPEERRKRIDGINEKIRAQNRNVQNYRYVDDQRQRSTKPEARKVDVKNFKNRYKWTADYQEPAVEALVGPWDHGRQYQEEKERCEPQEKLQRLKSEMGLLGAFRFRGGWRTDTTNNDDDNNNNNNNNNNNENDSKWEISWAQQERNNAMDVDPNDEYIHRIRIHSLPLLGHLTGVLDIDNWRDSTRSFMRPFMSLIYLQPYMKQVLHDLEERWAGVELDATCVPAEPQLQDATEQEVSIVDEAKLIENQSVQRSQAIPDNVCSQNDSARAAVAQGEQPCIINLDQMEVNGNSIQEPDASSDEESIYTSSIHFKVRDQQEINEHVEKTMDTIEALKDFRCYVKFIDDHLMSHYNVLRGHTDEKVIFDDLWYVFQPGDLVYRHKTDRLNGSGSQNELWRVFGVQSPKLLVPYRTRPLQDEGNKFTITCYSIDHNGSSYGAVRQDFDIHCFPGRKYIRSLPVSPLRVVKNRDSILQTLRQNGEKFHNVLTQRHQSYQNWTLSTDDSTFPEFVDSQVIVDLEEAFRDNPAWRPNFHFPARESDPSAFLEFVDDWRISFYVEGQEHPLFQQGEVFVEDNPIQIWQRRDHFKNDNFLKSQSIQYEYDDFDGKVTPVVASKDLALLPRRSFAYTLRERKFVSINIDHLSPVIAQHGVLESLKIQRDYKDLIRGLVSSHFQKKDLERNYTSQSVEGLSQDLIRGKGKGLVILLHGAPGVGKTATAEAVAMENSRPLFTITCGDLGLSPSEVETRLTGIFRLAHKWDCVLLLDEADVFLSQRSRFDLKRNALVSVFLRVLEYYNGLLFLTTNRVGIIDEAFKSRIHMSLYYPPLNKVQTAEIFRFNISQLRKIEGQKSSVTKQPELIINEEDIIEFAHRHFQENEASGTCWNGRQIRNSFQVASSLAHYHYQRGVLEAQKHGRDAPSAPQLSGDLFRTVQHATHHFDHYIRETKGWSDADYAHKLGERSDYVESSRFPPAMDTSNAQFNLPTQAAAGFPQYTKSPSPNRIIPSQMPGYPQYTQSPLPDRGFPGHIPSQNVAGQYESSDSQNYNSGHQQHHMSAQFGGNQMSSGGPTPTTPGHHNFLALPQTSTGPDVHGNPPSRPYLNPAAQAPAAFGHVNHEAAYQGGYSTAPTGSPAGFSQTTGRQAGAKMGRWEGDVSHMAAESRVSFHPSAAEEDISYT